MDRASHRRFIKKGLWLFGYLYSLAIFLFACALALSYKGIAFSPLHLKLKDTLVRAHATTGDEANQRLPASLPNNTAGNGPGLTRR